MNTHISAQLATVPETAIGRRIQGATGQVLIPLDPWGVEFFGSDGTLYKPSLHSYRTKKKAIADAEKYAVKWQQNARVYRRSNGEVLYTVLLCGQDWAIIETSKAATACQVKEGALIADALFNRYDHKTPTEAARRYISKLSAFQATQTDKSVPPELTGLEANRATAQRLANEQGRTMWSGFVTATREYQVSIYPYNPATVLDVMAHEPQETAIEPPQNASDTSQRTSSKPSKRARKAQQLTMPSEDDRPAVGDTVHVRGEGELVVVRYSQQPGFWRIHLTEAGSRQEETVSFPLDKFRRFHES